MASVPTSRVDWEAAFVRYVNMGPDRSMQRIADEVGVHKRTVTRAAIRLQWMRRLGEIEQKAAEKANAILIRNRAERVADTLKVIDASRSKFAAQLRVADFRLTGSDFVGLIKLENLLEGEATSRVELAELAPVLEAYNQAILTLAELARQVDQDTANRELARLDDQLRHLAAMTSRAAEDVNA